MVQNNKKPVYIIGGGTVFHVRPHLALTAPAYGKTARKLEQIVKGKDPERRCYLHLTKMAGGSSLETNEDIQKLLQSLIEDEESKIIFMNAALCDYTGNIQSISGVRSIDTLSGKEQPRLRTSLGPQVVQLYPARKLIKDIRKRRKDIFLVAFKTTAGSSKQQQFDQGMSLLKDNSCNLVLANDLHTRNNMILTPEMASYGNTTDRTKILTELVDITLARSSNEFTRTKLVRDKPQKTPWDAAPPSLRKVVEYCIEKGAYRTFNGKSVGHFGYKLDNSTLLSSRRKQNYNQPEGLYLTKVVFESDGSVSSYGGKPSAGVRSQFELLNRYNQFDCVVHFHCPMKDKAELNVRPQKYFECGSYQCGQNTAEGIRFYFSGKIGAVMLDKHGPNILFHKSTDPNLVISFIRENFDLSQPTR